MAYVEGLELYRGTSSSFETDQIDIRTHFKQRTGRFMRNLHSLSCDTGSGYTGGLGQTKGNGRIMIKSQMLWIQASYALFTKSLFRPATVPRVTRSVSISGLKTPQT